MKSAGYKIVHHKKFEREVLKLPVSRQKKIYQILTNLKSRPAELPANTIPLKGFGHVYRTRVGDVRLIYQVDHSSKLIKVLASDYRGNVYRLVSARV